MLKPFATAALLSTTFLISPSAQAQEFGDYGYDTLYALAFEHPGRGALTDRSAAATDYIESRLTFGDYVPTRQDFSWTQGGQTRNAQNVLLTMTGATEKFIVVGAHYDTAGMGSVLQGVDDNGSGAGVLTELAGHMAGLGLQTGLVFAGFGAEENGLRGSNAYVNMLTTEERENIAGMINIDSLITGDYMYAHAGTNYLTDPTLKSFWDSAHAIADDLGIDLRSNPGLNAGYPLDTGCCSDAGPFQALPIPILWLESTNWELGDLDGYTQTDNPGIATGATWHNATRDNWNYLVAALGEDRIPDRMSSYAQLLTLLLVEITGADVIASAEGAAAVSWQMGDLLTRSSSGLRDAALSGAAARLGADAETGSFTPSISVEGLAIPSGDSAAGYDDSAALSFVLGGSYQMSESLSLGASLGFARTKDNLDAGGDVTARNLTLGLDAAYRSGAFWGVAGLSHGTISLSGERDFALVSGLGVTLIEETFALDTDATATGLAFKAGYDMGTTGKVKFGPVIGLDYTRYKVDGFAEGSTGSTAMSYGKQTFESAELEIGGRVESAVDVGGLPVVLGASAMLVRELADGLPAGIDVTDASGLTRAVTFVEPDKTFGRVTLTADIKISPTASGWLSVGGRVGHDGGSATGLAAGLRFTF